ncbi:MAG: flippase-like domain-containing protein [Actinobacteria bacterium]|nr:flippase-like domain-containing protein [Actinomycetota bacterium]
MSDGGASGPTEGGANGPSASGASGGSNDRRGRRRLLYAALGIAVVVGFVYFVVPQLTGLGPTLHRLRSADPAWLALGVVLEALSLGGYIALFRTVFSCHEARIGWRASYQITMAGVVATKLFAAAGAGGVALTVWALRASGLGARSVARRMVGFELLLYAVYAGALVIVGIGLRSGLLAGPAPWALTVVPAILGGAVIVIVLSAGALPRDLERRARGLGHGGRVRRVLGKIATLPWTVRDGLGVAVELIREGRIALLGAVAYWGLDIATLWASFHAFGKPPPGGVIVMAYFVGALANALPIPGGFGGVEGGMIGAFLAFGTNASLAVLAVLSYRAISFWLPTLPGAAAYVQLRRTVSRWREEAGSVAAVPASPAGPG